MNLEAFVVTMAILGAIYCFVEVARILLARRATRQSDRMHVIRRVDFRQTDFRPVRHRNNSSS